MPVVAFTTNVKVDDVKAFVLELSKTSAEILNKPEPKLMVNFTYNEHLTFAGSFDPAFVLHISSLDNLNPSFNSRCCAAFSEHFEKRLGVPPSRGFIILLDPGREYMGLNGNTLVQK